MSHQVTGNRVLLFEFSRSMKVNPEG